MTISFKEDVPLPAQRDPNVAIGTNDMLIKVRSAAINPVDYKLPRVIAGSVVGFDVSGVVERVGSGVTDFQVGEAVFGRAASGSLADYTLVSADEVAIKPEWLPHDLAAALPVAYLTGLQSLRAGKVGGGASVLIIGASGGCGIAGVQLANAMGASRIVGICSGKNFEFVRGTSGIESVEGLELIDYTDSDALKKFREENVGKFDCIYDTATGSGKGEDYVPSMIPLLKEKTGEYVQINGPPSTWARHAMGKMKPQRTMILTSGKSKSALEEIVSLLNISNARPHLDVKSFDENGVKDGIEQLKGRRTIGKIVFNMD